MRRLRLLLVTTATAMLASCIGGQSMKEADALIAQFRDLAVAENYDGIEDLGSANFQDRTSAYDLAATIGAIAQSGCGEPQRVGTSFASTNGHTRIVERFSRQCDGGVLVEVFEISVEKKEALLETYEVQTGPTGNMPGAKPTPKDIPI